MVIVINHLTRMKAGHICAAGVHVESGRHIRPAGRHTTRFLARAGGPFSLGAVVDLGEVSPVGAKPEVEDHRFQPTHARCVDTVEPSEFWTLLTRLAKPRLRDLFGESLHSSGKAGCGVDVGEGTASLGCLVPASRPVLLLPKRPDGTVRVRLRVCDSDFNLDLSVTDIRLFTGEQFAPDVERIRWLGERLQTTRTAILSVGLTRAFSSAPDVAPLHWLQVNNIHLSDISLWE